MSAVRLPDGRTPIVISAHADDLMRTAAQALSEFHDQGSTVEEVAAHLLRTRRVRRHRAVIRAQDRDELASALRAVTAGDDHHLVSRSAVGTGTRLAFVFPGQGNQWPGMGAQAYRGLPVYRSAADECAAAFIAAGSASPLPYLLADESSTPFAEIDVEGAQFTHGVALARVWQACGITPDLTIGHSLGEIAAAYIAGSIVLPDAVAVVAARAGVVDQLSGDYAVAALGITPTEAEEVMAASSGWLELSVVNAPTSVAVAGDREAVLAAVDAVAGRGRFAREITVGFPVHTSVLEPLHDDFREQLPIAEFSSTAVQFIGAAIGDVVPAGTTFADYWYHNLRSMVRFDRAVDAAVRRGAGAFVEISAHPSLLHAMAEVLGDADPVLLVGSGHRDRALLDELSANIVTAAAADPVYRWDRLVDTTTRPLTGFPNAPMRATHMWATPDPLPAHVGVTVQVEQWRTASPARDAAGPPRAVAVISLGAGPLADPLTTGLARHPGVELVAAGAAETLVVLAPTLEDQDVRAAGARIVDLIGAGGLNYADVVGPRCCTVVLVTNGAEQTHLDDQLPLPGPAALAGLHRSIGFEFPDVAFGHLDLPVSTSLLGSDPARVVEALLAAADTYALRGSTGRTVLLRRDLDEAPPASPISLDDGLLDDVVITGGTGVIGMHYADYLAQQGARRITLLSRRGADAVTLAALATLRGRYGTTIVAPSCDLTDPGALTSVAAAHGGDGATLLIHTAGTATFAAARGLTAAAAADTFAAKLTGLVQLTELWPLRTDARILLCSSVSGIWGGHGHGVYSAANRMLDVVAAQQRAAGRQCVAVRWGLWPSSDNRTGIVDATEVAAIERSGLRPVAPVPAIEASLRAYANDPVVYCADATRLRLFLDSQQPGTVELSERPDQQAGSTLSPAQLVRTELAAVLSITDAGQLDLDAALFDLGIDSLLAIDLRKRLKHATGRSVALATLLGGITGTELVGAVERDDYTASTDHTDHTDHTDQKKEAVSSD